MAFPFQNIERSHSAASSIDVMIKGLEKPQKSTDDNDLVWMDDTLRSCAQRASDHEGKRRQEIVGFGSTFTKRNVKAFQLLSEIALTFHLTLILYTRLSRSSLLGLMN